MQALTQLPAGSILCPQTGGWSGFCLPEITKKVLVSNPKTPKIQKKYKTTKTQTNCKNHKTNINTVTNLGVLTANAAGLKQKVPSLKSELEHLKCGIFTLQETHYKKKGHLKIEGWNIFEAIRKKEFGGTMIGVHSGLQPILIQEYSEDFELLVVEAILFQIGFFSAFLT